ncbi:hypothetical protein ACF08M_36410 [Streptomyces sp. NPDC015032]|uniref:hypothetical protein n=1 Tax=Streptomyces sp. NPDC015032 TaxID=3364937 RepID=UPI0036F62BE4
MVTPSADFTFSTRKYGPRHVEPAAATVYFVPFVDVRVHAGRSGSTTGSQEFHTPATIAGLGRAAGNVYALPVTHTQLALFVRLLAAGSSDAPSAAARMTGGGAGVTAAPAGTATPTIVRGGPCRSARASRSPRS